MRIDIVTVFPEMVAAALDYSIVKRARERGLVAIHVVNLRDFTTDRHKTTDDMPYGGGGGMVMKIEPIARALDALTGAEGGRETAQAPADVVEGGAREEPGVAESVAHSVPSARQDAVNVSALPRTPRPRVLLTDPRGQRFTQELAQQWAREPHIVLLCGHYEGVDERVRRHLVTDEVSIGDYILTGGELPALVIVDALTRLQPGALGDEDAPAKDSFAENLLEYPHYTRPRLFRGWAVPEILFSGHHAQIERWRRWHQLRATQERRPDLFARLRLATQDAKLLTAEEPTAPPDKKRTAPKTAEPQEVGGSALEPVEETEEREEADGTGTGNDTRDRARRDRARPTDMGR